MRAVRTRELEDILEIVTAGIDEENYEPNGAWVYRLDTGLDMEFRKFDTIADAIRRAVKLEGAIVICDGKEVAFDMSDKHTAYYIDKNKDFKLVRL